MSLKGDFTEVGGSIAAIITFPTPDWTKELKSSYAKDTKMAELMLKLESKLEFPKEFTMQQGIILRKGRIVVVSSSPFKKKVILIHPFQPTDSHTGFLKSYQRAKSEFYWRAMKKDVKKLVRECAVCQKKKGKNYPASWVAATPAHSPRSLVGYIDGLCGRSI